MTRNKTIVTIQKSRTGRYVFITPGGRCSNGHWADRRGAIRAAKANGFEVRG